jgi:hypothetical protein
MARPVGGLIGEAHERGAAAWSGIRTASSPNRKTLSPWGRRTGAGVSEHTASVSSFGRLPPRPAGGFSPRSPQCSRSALARPALRAADSRAGTRRQKGWGLCFEVVPGLSSDWPALRARREGRPSSTRTVGRGCDHNGGRGAEVVAGGRGAALARRGAEARRPAAAGLSRPATAAGLSRPATAAGLSRPEVAGGRARLRACRGRRLWRRDWTRRWQGQGQRSWAPARWLTGATVVPTTDRSPDG